MIVCAFCSWERFIFTYLHRHKLLRLENKTDRDGVAMMMCTPTSEVIVSYLGQDIGYTY